ncbi:MAG: hypothetical protein Ct9H300mP15_00880 [Gemmatimonadota bacterium]|nr:MAG: hypothetical protein Ct9H300mP15_00880 [Gemmatimonadota bacterium]
MHGWGGKVHRSSPYHCSPHARPTSCDSGRLEAEPGAPNVIPGRVTMTLEIRDLSMAGIERVFKEISGNSVGLQKKQGLASHSNASIRAGQRQLLCGFERLSKLPLKASAFRPTACPQEPVTSSEIALFAPVGMIFVPPVAGVSHAPDEHTIPQDIVNGANVLLQTLLELDEGEIKSLKWT